MSNDVEMTCYYRAIANEPVAVRHAEVSRRMKGIDDPIGWANANVPGAPEFGKDVSANYDVVYRDRNIKCMGEYAYRSAEYLKYDRAAYDDLLVITLNAARKSIDYKNILNHDFARVVEAFNAYRAAVSFGLYAVLFEDENSVDRERLRIDPAIDTDGRNNIYTLEPAHYWDAELCQRALGYGRDEVIKRLSGMVPLVKPLMDGVYIVFNDNPDLTFEEFCAVNDRFKPILGLV
jgi:hypothetical protein